MKQLCVCAATSSAVGPGEGARERAGLGPLLSPPHSAPPRPRPRPTWTPAPRPWKTGSEGVGGCGAEVGGWVGHLGRHGYVLGSSFENRWGHWKIWRDSLEEQFLGGFV